MALGTLVSGVAHEINNPNHIILMAVSTLKRVWDDAQRLLEESEVEDDCVVGGLDWAGVKEHMPQLLASLKRSSERIKEIVQDLRTYAGPEGERNEGTRRRVRPGARRRRMAGRTHRAIDPAIHSQLPSEPAPHQRQAAVGSSRC